MGKKSVSFVPTLKSAFLIVVGMILIVFLNARDTHHERVMIQTNKAADSMAYSVRPMKMYHVDVISEGACVRTGPTGKGLLAQELKAHVAARARRRTEGSVPVQQVAST